MAAQRAARRFFIVMSAGNAAHIDARVAFGLRKPRSAVGPLATNSIDAQVERGGGHELLEISAA